MPPCRHEPVQCGGIGRLAGRLSGSGIWRFVPPPPLHRAGTQFFYSAAPPPSPRPSLALTHTHSLLYAWNTHAHLNYSFGVDESRPLATSRRGKGDMMTISVLPPPSFAFVTTATAAHTHNICRACMWAAPNDRQEYNQLRRSISSQPNILSAPSLLIEAD